MSGEEHKIRISNGRSKTRRFLRTFGIFYSHSQFCITILAILILSLKPKKEIYREKGLENGGKYSNWEGNRFGTQFLTNFG